MTTAGASPAMTPAVNSAVSVARSVSLTDDNEYQQLMSDLFHDLSQPLSTLTCLVEVNLLLSRSLKQLRHDLKIALQQVYSIVRLVRALRELWEAGTEQQDRQVVPLAVCLREAVADSLPAAEAAGVKVALIASCGCLVNFQPSRLRQALFHLLEFAVGSSGAGAEVKIAAGEKDDVVRVTVAVSAAGGIGSKAPGDGGSAELGECRQRELKRRLRLAIVRRIFESANGALRAENSGEQVWLEVRLPSASLPK